MGVVPREGGLAAANQFVRTGAMPVLRPVAVLPPAVPVIDRGARVLQVAVHPEILPVFVPAMVLPVVGQAIVRGAGAAQVALLTEFLPVVLPVVVQAIVRGAGAAQVAVHPEVLPAFVPAMVLPVAALVQTPRPEVAENTSSAAAAQRNFAAPTGCPQDR